MIVDRLIGKQFTKEEQKLWDKLITSIRKRQGVCPTIKAVTLSELLRKADEECTELGGWFIDFDKGLDNKFCSYPIDGDRLEEPDWIPHMLHTRWVDMNAFLPIFFNACIDQGIEKLEIDLSTYKDYKFSSNDFAKILYK